MALENFTYTGSPWGYTAPGWTVLQRSPGVNPKAAESLRRVFRYTGPDSGPVRYVHLPDVGGKRVFSLSADAGLRWYDKTRGHDYFAHIFLEDASAPVPAGFNPAVYALSASFQRAFPEALKEKALKILQGRIPNEEPPLLAAAPGVSALVPAPALSAAAAFEDFSLPDEACERLADVASAFASRIRAGGPPLVFDASCPAFLPFVASALSLVPESLRAKAAFATFVAAGEAADFPELRQMCFIGVDAAGRGADPATGLASDVPRRGVRHQSCAEVRRAVAMDRYSAALREVRDASSAVSFIRFASALDLPKGVRMDQDVADRLDFARLDASGVAETVRALRDADSPFEEIISRALAAERARAEAAFAAESARRESEAARKAMESRPARSGGASAAPSRATVAGADPGKSGSNGWTGAFAAFAAGVFACALAWWCFGSSSPSKSEEDAIADRVQSLDGSEAEIERPESEPQAQAGQCLRPAVSRESSLEKDYSAIMERAKRLQEENRKLKEVKRWLADEKAKVERRLNELESQAQNSVAEYPSAALAEMAGYQQKTDALIKLKDETIANLQKSNGELASKVANLDDEIRMLNSRLANGAPVPSASASLDGAKDKDDLEKRIEKEKARLDKREKALKEREDKLDDDKKNVKKAWEQIHKARSDFENDRKKLMKEKSGCEKEKKEAEAAKKAWEEKKKRLDAEYEDKERALEESVRNKIERDRLYGGGGR